MTGRSVVEQAFALQKPARMPVALVAGGEWYVHQAGKTFAEIKNDPGKIAGVFVENYRRLGQDLMWTGAGLLNYPVHCLGCPIQDDTSDSPKLSGTVIQSLDAVETLDIDRVIRHPTLQAIVASHHRIADAIGSETVILATQWGPLTVAARILGVESVMMAFFERPEKLHALIGFATEMIWAIWEPILDHPDVLGINISDPVASGDMISPSIFREFVAPYHTRLVSRAKAKEKYAGIHICGDSTPILGDIVKIAPSCFSLESKVDLNTARTLLGGKVCVLGNVSPTGKFLSGTPQEVIAEAEGCIRAWGPHPGFILTVGCDFPKQVPFENVSALMSLKGYPG